MRLHEEVSIEKIKEVIKDKFLGKIKQTPPVKSRVKRVEREREVKSFEILEKDGKDFLFKTHVQGGTYIRKLIDDLGKELGIGAHMLELRRVIAGIFEEAESITLYDLDKIINDEDKLKSIIIPGEAISKVYPIVEIEEECISRVLHGQPIYDKNLSSKARLDKEQIICVFSKDKFIGMFKVLNEGKIFAKSEFTMQEVKSS
jgi:H/ACA ribonucleoprotein complex subunit 4